MNEQELNIVVERYDNDELATANEALADAYFSFRGEYERVVAENDELRELMRKLGHFEKFGCHECPHEERCAKSIYDVDCSMRLEIEKEMRKLGIDVE